MTIKVIEIIVNGKDNASSPLGSVGSALSRMGDIAGGIIGANTLLAIGRGIFDMGQQALDSYAKFERLGLSLQTLSAKELMATQTKEAYAKFLDAESTMTDTQIQQWTTMRGSYDQAVDKIQSLIAAGTTSGQTFDWWRTRAQGLSVELQKSIPGFANLTDESKAAALGQLNMSWALDLSAQKAKDLQGWVTKLAIQSPFKQEDIANAFRLNMAYGFTTAEAQRLTQATVDFAAGSGASQEAMQSISLALGQIQAKGKLSGQEVLQLTNAGLNVRDILAKAFGVTTEQIVKMQERGLIPADKAIKAITESLEADFGGAAARQSQSFSGLVSSLEDIKSVGLREFFTGTFQEIQPYVAGFVEKFSDPAFMASINEFGQKIGTAIGDAIPKIIEFAGQVQGFLDRLRDTGGNALKAIQPGLDGFAAFWAQNGPSITGSLMRIWESLEKLGKFAVEYFGPLVAQVFNSWGAWFQQNGPLIAEMVGKLADFFQQRLVPALQQFAMFAGNIILMISSLIQGFAQFFMQIASGQYLEAFTQIGVKGQEVFTALEAAIWAFFDGIAALFGTTFAEIGQQWQANFDLMGETAVLAWEKIKEGFSNGLQAVKDALFGWWTDFTGTWKFNIDSLASSMSTIGGRIVDGLKAGILTGWEGFSSWLTKMVKGIIEAIMKTLGIKSPSTVFAGIGENMMLGLAQGISGSNAPVLALNQATNNLINVNGASSSRRGAAGGITIIVQGAHDPMETANAVARVLRANGVGA